MKLKFLPLLLALLLLSGCSLTKKEPIDETKAVEIIKSEYENASIITVNDKNSYFEIDFDTKHNPYTATVNKDNGNIMSVKLREVVKEYDPYDFSDNTTEYGRISSAVAFNNARVEANADDTVIQVKNELSSDGLYYEIIFKTGAQEYYAKVDAYTGIVVSFETQLDS